MNKTKQTAHLEQWIIHRETVYGIVSGHPKLPDGLSIQTSRIVKLSDDRKACETMNTLYTLGEPYNPQTTVSQEQVAECWEKAKRETARRIFGAPKPGSVPIEAIRASVKEVISKRKKSEIGVSNVNYKDGLDRAIQDVIRLTQEGHDKWSEIQKLKAEIDALKQRNLELESAYSGCEGANNANKALIKRLGEINDALKAEVERLRDMLPMTPNAVIGFIGSNFNSMEPTDELGHPTGDLERVKYYLSVHDLLSAFDDLAHAMADKGE